MVSLGIVYGEIGSLVSHPVNRIAYVGRWHEDHPQTQLQRDMGGVGGIDRDWEIVFRF